MLLTSSALTLFVLPALSSVLRLPQGDGNDHSVINSTLDTGADPIVWGSDSFYPVTMSKLETLTQLTKGQNISFFATEAEFTSGIQEPPVRSPFTIRRHLIVYVTADDPPTEDHLQYSNPRNWKKLGETYAGRRELLQYMVPWDIAEAKTSIQEALRRLSEAGCKGGLTDLELSKTKEVTGNARIWHRIVRYQEDPRYPDQMFTAWVSDDPTFSHPVLIANLDDQHTFMTCDGKVVDPRGNAAA